MSGYFDTYGYCLLDNHFHLMIRVKNQDEILQLAKKDFEVVNRRFLKDYVKPWVEKGQGFQGPLNLSDFGNLTDLDRLTNLTRLIDLAKALSAMDKANANPHQTERLDEQPFLTQIASWCVSERFRGFLLGYAKAINKQEKRTGGLFQQGFRRKNIPNENFDKKQVLTYIHHNPIHHFYTSKYEDYIWSSFNPE